MSTDGRSVGRVWEASVKWKPIQMPQELECIEDGPNYGRFVIEPLERGFGITLGTALRRTLLSSIQGAAVTALRIDDVLHEFTTVEGVLEDVTELVLNVKGIRLRLYGDEPRTIVLSAPKQGTYTAGDLDTDPEVEILNPEHHIATVGRGGRLRMEMDVGFGRGFVPADANKRPGAPVGTIWLDSTFTPILRANTAVENTRVGQRTDYDRLTLDIWTDGGITPEDAVRLAARVLRDHLTILLPAEEVVEEPPEPAVDDETKRVLSLLSMRVDELELSVRASNCLKAANIETLADLVVKSESEMLKFRNFGRKSLNELGAILQGLGLSFGMDVSGYVESAEAATTT
jgi:DNA-directed RNA polymerase subunit alpha